MQVTVHLAPAVALELKGGAVQSTAAHQVVSVAKAMGFELRPMHPGSAAPGMASTFIVEVKDEGTAKQIAARLRDLEAVEAAYVKPVPGMP